MAWKLIRQRPATGFQLLLLPVFPASCAFYSFVGSSSKCATAGIWNRSDNLELIPELTIRANCSRCLGDFGNEALVCYRSCPEEFLCESDLWYGALNLAMKRR